MKMVIAFTFELPNSKRVIGFKLLTQKDENEIEEILKIMKKLKNLQEFHIINHKVKASNRVH